MTNSYTISHITCGSCVAKVKKALENIDGILDAQVQITAPQAVLTMQKKIPLPTLQQALNAAGAYTISEIDTTPHGVEPKHKTGLQTYKPILLLCAFITGVSVMESQGDWMIGMRIFMAGFFLSFSFFKLLDLKAFASAYKEYDIVAKKIPVWAYVYPFIELGLGVLYTLNIYSRATTIVALVVMSLSIVGVVNSVLNKRKIRCACLGTVFNLPMSTVTIIEDGLMIVMSAIMLLTM